MSSPDVPEDVVPQGQLDAYIAAVGRDLAYVYLTNNWFYSRHFPLEVARRVRARGAVPVVRLMLRASDDEAGDPDGAEAGYSLAELAGGELDADLTTWAREASQLDGLIYAEYGTEVNGQWFSWNARWNGEQAGAALFVRAYRHLAHVVEAAGAHNVRWIFHMAAEDDPATVWNHLEAYYPGGDIINVLGISAYGTQTPLETDIQSLRIQLDSVMPRLALLAPQKPALLLEFGSVAGASEKPEVWADTALKDLISGRWPQLRGFSWWDSGFRQDDGAPLSEMRVERQPALAAIFRRQLSSERVSTVLDLQPWSICPFHSHAGTINTGHSAYSIPNCSGTTFYRSGRP